MSGSKVRKDRKLKIMTEEAGLDETAREQAKSIARMYEDRDRKAIGAKMHLVSQIEIMSRKCLTANGVMAALEVVRDVFGNNGTDYVEEISIAKSAATRMSEMASKMAERARTLNPDDMSMLCDDLYDEEFSKGKSSALELIDELLILHLCQNIGPNAEDVSDFCRTADEEIEKARESLREFCDENSIDFNELCGPHDNCPECLCNLCTNDCKEGRMLEDGKSALDICDKFLIEGK